MEYEKIILNLIERVSILEEKVAELEGNKKIEPKPERGTYTSLVIDYIEKSIAKAKENGKHSICLTSGGIQKDVGLKNRLPLVCNAMRKCMDEKSVVIYETPSGQSSTFAVQWNF